MAHPANRHIAPARQTPEERQLTVVIPAAGIGKRMKSKGPKGLLTVHPGIPILERQVNTILKVYPYADIIIVGGFENNRVRDALWGRLPVRIVCNPLYEITNVCHSIAIGMNASLPGPLLIIHGDLVFNAAAIKGLAGEASALSLAGSQLEKDEVGIGYQDGMVTTLSYALPHKWGQMAYLQDKELELLREDMWHHKLSHQWFLYEALNRVMGRGGVFLAHKPKGAKLIEVDRFSDLEKANSI